MIHIQNKCLAHKTFLDSEGIPSTTSRYFSEFTAIFIVHSVSGFKNARCQAKSNKTSIIIDYSIKDKIFNGRTIKTHVTKFSKNNFSIVNGESHKGKVKIYTSYIDGNLVICPSVDLNEIMSCCIPTKKRIFFLENTYEDYLTFFDKRNVRSYMLHLVDLAHQFHKRPILSLWKHPYLNRTSFNLRIDVDPDRNTNNEEALRRIHSTFRQAYKWKDRITLALNMYKRSPNYDYFYDYVDKGFDLQSHNFFHYHYPFKWMNIKNINAAHVILNNNNVSPVGFISPENYYNDNVYEYINDRRYKYASSFGCDYINYPYKPIVNNKILSFYEIPVDPLVYSKISQMTNNSSNISTYEDYYKSSIRDSYNNLGQTCFKYEHTAVLGRHPSIMETIMESIDQYNDVNMTTLTKYASWLHKRSATLDKIDFNYSALDESISILCRNGKYLDNDLSVSFRMPFKDEYLVGRANDKVFLKEMCSISNRSNTKYSQPKYFSPLDEPYKNNFKIAKKSAEAFILFYQYLMMKKLPK